MISLLRTLSIGYLSGRPMRSLLVVLSIALGVAALVATQALDRGINKGIQEGVNPLGGIADLLIVNGEAGVPIELADELREARIDGVHEVTPFVNYRISVADLNNKTVWLIGVDWPNKKSASNPFAGEGLAGVTLEQTYHPKTLRDKLTLHLYSPALVSENLARELQQKVRNKPEPLPDNAPLDLRVLDWWKRQDRGAEPLRFHLRNAGMTPKVTLFGTVDFSKSKLPLRDSHVVVMSLQAASAICYPDNFGYVNQIAIALEKGSDPATVREGIEAWLGKRAQVQSIADSQGLVADVTAGLQIGFAIGGAGALVVGLFLVYIILSVNVAERRHDIGILRSVGATRGQVAGLFVGEATCMGLFGSALGLPLGWLLAWLAIQPTSHVVSDLMVPIDAARIELPLWLMGVALLSGTIVADLAALVPALHAASEEPADAVRRVPRSNLLLFYVLPISGTAMLLVIGIGMARFRHYLPARVGMFAGIVCILVGALIATPVLASLVGRIVQPLFRYALGLEGRLAADNLVRSPGRTGVVIGALAATGALMVQTAGFLKSSRDAIREWVDEKIAADLFVTSGGVVTSGGATITMQDSMGDKLRKVPGVEAVLPVRFHQLQFSPIPEREVGRSSPEKRIIWLVAIDTWEFVRSAGDRPLARSLQQYPGLREPGKVCISENFSALYGIKVGDHFKIPIGGHKGELEVEVIGVVVDYTWNRGTILVDLEWYRQTFGDHQVNIFDVFLKPTADLDAVREEIMDRYGASEALFVVARPVVNQDVQDTMNKVYSLAYAQQGVIGLVALLGVVSALYISVLQRGRDLGLLRAVGATRGQILRSVLAEAVLMGIIGAVVGFGIGLLLEWYVMEVLLLDESGFSFPLRIPWWEAGIVSLASVVLATLAGLWPAYLATRLRIPEAIAYE